MRKIYFVLLLFIQSLVSAQGFKFGVISSPEISDKNSESKLNSYVQLINSFEKLNFVIVTGNVSANGKNLELEKAKEILDAASKNYFVIPGESDSRLSESASAKFPEIWGDDKFIYEIDSTIFIGFNSAINWQTGGHIKPEDLKWLNENLSGNDSSKTVFLFVYHNPKNEIDNWFEITNLLNKFTKSVIFYGSGKELKVEKINNIQAISIPDLNSAKDLSLNLLESRNDSLFIYEAVNDSTKKLLNKISLLKQGSPTIIDSSSFINYEAEILWNYDFKYSLPAEPAASGDFIYVTDKSGLITCFDTIGNVVWEYNSFGTIISNPVVADGIFAAATLRGDLLTLNATTGESIQTIGFDDLITTPLITIEYSDQTNFLIPKLTDSKTTVILGTASGKLYCFDLETLQQIWVFDKVKGMIAAQPVYAQNKIIFPAFDNHLYCIDARRGSLIWKWNGIKNQKNFPVLSNPVVNNESVFITSPNGNVYGIDLQLGKTIWENEKLSAYQSIGISQIGHRLFVKSSENRFHIISAKTSTWVKEINIKFGEDKTSSCPIEYNGKILVGTKSGHVYSIDENFKYTKLFFMGTSSVHTIKHFKENLFIAANTDGKIVLFKID